MLVCFAVVLPVVILLCGLSLDVAMLHLRALQMQTAADAGAIGAELEAERGTGAWATAGSQDASINGFKNGSNGTTVSVTRPATIGAYAGRYDAIQVSITQQVATIFMGSLNNGSVTVSAQAVSLVPPCTYFLGLSSVSSNPTFNNASAGMNSNCPVYITPNFTVDGFSNLIGFGIDIGGSSSASTSGGGWTSQLAQGSKASGPPTFNTPVLPDPLASVAQPSFSSCTTTAYSITAGSATLNPGTYCGTSSKTGMTISNATVYLNPGLYIITGGVNWTHATVSGSGVTLFFTKGNGANYGQITVSSQSGLNSSLNLSAPTDSSSGGIPYILFFADRNWIATASHDFILNTQTSFTGDGIWYMPATGVYIWNASVFSYPNYGSMVVSNIYVFGTNIHPSGNYSSFPGGSPFRKSSVLVQ